MNNIHTTTFFFTTIVIFIMTAGCGTDLSDSLAKQEHFYGIRTKMKEIADGFMNHHDIYNKFPVAKGPTGQHYNQVGVPLVSWRVHLPIDQSTYESEPVRIHNIDKDKSWDDPSNHKQLDAIPSVYRCYSDDPPATTRFRVLSGPGTPFENWASPSLSDFTDGLADTILFVEAGADRAVPWARPERLAYDPSNPLQALGQIDPTGIKVIFADGSFGLLDPNIAPEEFAKLVTHQGGEPVDKGKLLVQFDPQIAE